jgi:predicted esterase
VSWYEANAYCAFVGKRLPLIYHWYRAAEFQNATDFVRFSNLASAGSEVVGQPQRIGTNGTYDMSGNAKEWVFNETIGGRRFILGGAWNEPTHMFWDHDAQPPGSRDATYGFRCATYGTVSSPLIDRVDVPRRDYRTEHPVNDALFRNLSHLFASDVTPLDGRVDSVETEPEWRLERVSFAASYARERVPALLYLPTNARPPYQAIVWFPSAGAFFGQNPIGSGAGQREFYQFLIRSGRALLFPTYKGSYDRRIGEIQQPNTFRDIVIGSFKDLTRAVDYLETRSDIDSGRIAFVGMSLGAAVGPIMTALEPRFKASVLLSGGLYAWRRAPEAEAINFLPRVRVPTLMVNGRHDFFFPVEEAQKPMLNLLGTPSANKHHVILPSGHSPHERYQVVKETLDWLDRYLGRVTPR